MPSPKVSVDKEPQQSQTDNSKKTKGRAKTVASNKRTRQPLPVDIDMPNKKDKRKIADTEKKKGPKVDTKARSGRTNSRRKGVPGDLVNVMYMNPFKPHIYNYKYLIHNWYS